MTKRSKTEQTVRTNLCLPLFVVFAAVFAGGVNGQIPVPRPIAETEIRDGSSIRMRSIDLERVKQDASKIDAGTASIEQDAKLRLIKDDFESIQALQDSIIQIYTRSQIIDVRKIAAAAAEIQKRSVRLDSNLFSAEPDETARRRKNSTEKIISMRDLIIELDAAIQNFINSPIFQNSKLLDADSSKNAKNDLGKIIDLSGRLAANSKK